MVSETLLARLSRQHTIQRSGIQRRLVSQLLALWSRPIYNDPPTVASYAARSATLVEAALTAVSKSQSAYLSLVLGAMGLPARQPRSATVYPRSGTTVLDVYRRPEQQVRWELSQGRSSEAAVNAAIRRVTALASDDLSAAMRDQTKATLSAQKKVVGYRRMIHPELSKTGSCGLCVVASTNFYTVKDLMPLHTLCKCGVMPITKDLDPGLKLNADDLQKFYDAAGSTAAEDLVRTRVVVHENGELGPILRRDGDSFRTPTEAGSEPYTAPTVEDDKNSARAMINAAQTTIDELQARLTAGETFTETRMGSRSVKVDNRQAVAFNQALIERQKQKLAA